MADNFEVRVGRLEKRTGQKVSEFEEFIERCPRDLLVVIVFDAVLHDIGVTEPGGSSAPLRPIPAGWQELLIYKLGERFGQFAYGKIADAVHRYVAAATPEERKAIEREVDDKAWLWAKGNEAQAKPPAAPQPASISKANGKGDS